MTLPGKSNKSRSSTKDKHLARNCVPKNIKKHGAGKSNWGSIDTDINDGMHEVVDKNEHSPMQYPNQGFSKIQVA
jgi:hypothetical protein